MITIKVDLVAKPETASELAQKLQTIAESSLPMAGCQSFEILKDISKEYTYALYEVWQDEESFVKYKNSTVFAETTPPIMPLLADKPISLYLRSEAFELP